MLKKKKFRFYASYSIFLLLVSSILLKLVDYLIPSTNFELFPPNTQVHYLTSEFDAMASTNKFGFRGSEEKLKKGQVIAVGDSFTFGFGNNNDDTWPKILATQLKANGLNYEVYNLGVPGSDTIYHLTVADNFVKTLEPRYVIIPVLLSDDFQQVLEQELKLSSSFSKRIPLEIREWLPNLNAWLMKFSYKKNEENAKNIQIVTASWQKDAEKYLKDEAVLYPDNVRARIRDGDINPGLLYYGRHFSDRSWLFWEEATTQGSAEYRVLNLIKKRLTKLNELVASKGGNLIIFSMPSGAFVRSKVTNNYRSYGIQIPEELLSTFKPEKILSEVAKESGAVFIPSLEQFRSFKGKDDLFFPYDGHLTPKGNAKVADLIASFIIDSHQVVGMETVD